MIRKADVLRAARSRCRVSSFAVSKPASAAVMYCQSGCALVIEAARAQASIDGFISSYSMFGHAAVSTLEGCCNAYACFAGLARGRGLFMWMRLGNLRGF